MFATQQIDRKTQLAAQIGVAPDRIHSVRLQLDTLRKQGLLIDLNISGTSMFTRSATLAELGIADGDIRAVRFTPGQKFLYPENEVRRIHTVESRMRQWLKRLTFSITGFHPYVWLPYTAYPAWRQRWEELSAEFYAVKTDYLAHYDEYRDLFTQEFTAVAEAAWRSIQAQGDRQAAVDGRPYRDQAGFTGAVLERALLKFPTRERIELELHADYSTGLVWSEEDLAADQLQAQRIRAQIETEQNQHRAQQQEAYLQSSILQEQYNHTARMNRLEQQEKEIHIAAMLQAEAEHAREALHKIVSPYEEIFTALRQQFAESAAEMLESIHRNGFVAGKVAEKGRGLIELFDLLAIHDDGELRQRLLALRSALNQHTAARPADRQRTTAEIKAVLTDIQTLSQTAAADLSATPSIFAFVEI